MTDQDPQERLEEIQVNRVTYRFKDGVWEVLNTGAWFPIYEEIYSGFLSHIKTLQQELRGAAQLIDIGHRKWETMLNQIASLERVRVAGDELDVLIEAWKIGEYKFDSFSFQPLQTALACCHEREHPKEDKP